MGFYEEMKAYYEDIFPLAAMKRHWMMALVEDTGGGEILDMGCATGALCNAMADYADRVDGFDLDEGMIGKARESYKGNKLRFRVGDMLKLTEVFGQQTYDVVTCFGNTLVHVRQSELKTVFDQVYGVLKDDGVFVGQILNYDYVLDAKVTTLPLIDNSKISFERYYDRLTEGRLDFRTKLKVKKTGTCYDNVIPLYPLRKEVLEGKLRDAGFTSVRFYKNYKGEPAEGQHLPLIFVADV